MNGTTGVTLHPERMYDPLGWRKSRLVFVNSLSDLFHEQIPYGFIRDVFNVMRRCDGGVVLASGKRDPAHTFQVLTKRPEVALDLWRTRKLGFDVWPPNVWLGVSIENARFTWRADVLREIPAAVRFISAEPLLDSLYPPSRLEVSVRYGDEALNHLDLNEPRRKPLDLTGIDWVIAGGESGPGARPMRAEWAREIRDHCTRDGIPFFFKQWGGPTSKSGGRLLDGREWNDMPPMFTGVAA